MPKSEDISISIGFSPIHSMWLLFVQTAWIVRWWSDSVLHCIHMDWDDLVTPLAIFLLLYSFTYRTELHHVITNSFRRACPDCVLVVFLLQNLATNGSQISSQEYQLSIETDDLGDREQPGVLQTFCEFHKAHRSCVCMKLRPDGAPCYLL